MVLVVQDTTELDYTSHPPRDARCLDKPYRFGLYDHAHLAVTPDRLCLGVVGGEQFDRTPESLGRTEERTALPIEEKESFRWLTGYRQACQLGGGMSPIQESSASAIAKRTLRHLRRGRAGGTRDREPSSSFAAVAALSFGSRSGGRRRRLSQGARRSAQRVAVGNSDHRTRIDAATPDAHGDAGDSRAHGAIKPPHARVACRR